MEIKVTTTIEKPVADVWEVMGNQFGQVDVWSSNFKTSKPGGEARFEGLGYSLRDTTTDRGNTIAAGKMLEKEFICHVKRESQ